VGVGELGRLQRSVTGRRLVPPRSAPPRKSPKLAENPDRDVITFREALRRAAVFSHATQHHSSTLYRLSATRDDESYELDQLGAGAFLYALTAPNVWSESAEAIGHRHADWSWSSASKVGQDD
jgi:hypothetical protein